MMKAGKDQVPGQGLCLGLTGGMGCGKSTALGFFATCGATAVETDSIVRDLLATDAELIAALAEAFGQGILDAEGKIDRRMLGRTVFHNPDALARLESLVHPRVRARWMDVLREGHPFLVVEIPLLFEKGLETHFTSTVCLSSRPEIQQQRLKERGMSDSQIQTRMQRQFSLEEKMRRADIVLLNNGNRDHLREQVELAVATLKRTHSRN